MLRAPVVECRGLQRPLSRDRLALHAWAGRGLEPRAAESSGYRTSNAPNLAPLLADVARHSVTMSPWRWATFHSPSSRRYTCVARKV